MPNYRRVWVPGGTYFFTVNLLERRRTLLTDHIDSLRNAFAQAKAARAGIRRVNDAHGFSASILAG